MHLIQPLGGNLGKEESLTVTCEGSPRCTPDCVPHHSSLRVFAGSSTGENWTLLTVTQKLGCVGPGLLFFGLHFDNNKPTFYGQICLSVPWKYDD